MLGFQVQGLGRLGGVYGLGFRVSGAGLGGGLVSPDRGSGLPKALVSTSLTPQSTVSWNRLKVYFNRVTS